MRTVAVSPVTLVSPTTAATSMRSTPSVAFTVTVSAAPSRRHRPENALEIDVDVQHVGPREVVDGRQVGTAERLQIDLLDLVDVHHDVPRLPGEASAALRSRGELEDLVPGRAVEDHRVGAVLTFDDVASVARIPGEAVVAGVQVRDVGARVAVDVVVAVSAEQEVGSVASEDRVVLRRRRRRRA